MDASLFLCPLEKAVLTFQKDILGQSYSQWKSSSYIDFLILNTLYQCKIAVKQTYNSL